MIDLTNLEICQNMAKIEKLNQVEIKEKVLVSHGFSCDRHYNPLTDDALIFLLAFKHKVKIDYFDECVYMKYPRRKLARHLFDKDNIASLRKAICLAIIEAHKELLS